MARQKYYGRRTRYTTEAKLELSPTGGLRLGGTHTPLTTEFSVNVQVKPDGGVSATCSGKGHLHDMPPEVGDVLLAFAQLAEAQAARTQLEVSLMQRYLDLSLPAPRRPELIGEVAQVNDSLEQRWAGMPALMVPPPSLRRGPVGLVSCMLSTGSGMG